MEEKIIIPAKGLVVVAINKFQNDLMEYAKNNWC